MVVVLVESMSYSVQSNGLVQQFVAGGALHLKCQMVPRIGIGVARDTGGNPTLVEVVPAIPFVTAGDAAFVTPNEAHTIEELVDIELQRLSRSGTAHPKICIVGEVMIRRHQRVIRVGDSLRGEGAD